MARQNRLVVAGLPHHVLWRGHNAERVFRDDSDRRMFLAMLAEQSHQLAVQVHAYLLLDDQVRLLLRPQHEAALSALMQGLGRSYGRRFNLRHERQGTLWAGRYRCTVMEPGELELSTMVCLDAEPVRAGLVDAPAGFEWSSHAHYLGRRHDSWLTFPAAYWSLGNTPFAREAAYAARAAAGVGTQERHKLLDAAARGWALGSADFLRKLQEQTGRRLLPARPGRPRKPV